MNESENFTVYHQFRFGCRTYQLSIFKLLCNLIFFRFYHVKNWMNFPHTNDDCRELSGGVNFSAQLDRKSKTIMQERDSMENCVIIRKTLKLQFLCNH